MEELVQMEPDPTFVTAQGALLDPTAAKVSIVAMKRAHL